ncbi:hypothetical protein [Paenibacillus kandeliae]|uniref:hypothetical protein n=1 Tax=Paenibacillus kandeliae TaxID=3231269 RepID=UPI0034586256
MKQEKQEKNKSEKFDGYNTSIKYLINKFNLKSKWYQVKFNLDLQNIEIIKEKLIEEHSSKELSDLKTDLEGDYDQLKLLAPVISIMAVGTTIVGFILNNSIGLRDRAEKSISDMNEKLLILEQADLTNLEIKQKSAENLLQNIDQARTTLGITLFHSFSLSLLGIAVIIVGWQYFRSTKNISILLNVVTQAYSEKKEKEQKNYKIRVLKNK